MTAIDVNDWRIALVGTPNSGKTALFNALTGSRQKVANYAGVTVERKSGVLRTASGHRVDLIDLPGTYSLRGRSPDEDITRDVILGKLASESPPDFLLCVADATNLRVALRLVIELKRVHRPMLLVLNMIDIARRRGVGIDLDKLSVELEVRSSHRPQCGGAALTTSCTGLTTSPASRQVPSSGATGLRRAYQIFARRSARLIA